MKKIYSTKLFALFTVFFSLFSFGMILNTVLDWENSILPLYPACTNNNISGYNYFSYFTVISNLFCILWLIAYAISIVFKSNKLMNFISRPYLVLSLTVYIFLTGFIYNGLIVWFIDYYPWKSHFLFNISDIFNHLLMPMLITVLWCFMPREKMDYKKSYVVLTFPLIYGIVTMFRGIYIKWYPYPFLDTNYLEDLYSSYLILPVFVIFIALIMLLSIMFIAISNKINEKRIRRAKV